MAAGSSRYQPTGLVGIVTGRPLEIWPAHFDHSKSTVKRVLSLTEKNAASSATDIPKARKYRIGRRSDRQQTNHNTSTEPT